jgi:alpha-methylacyl-CoA racemase
VTGPLAGLKVVQLASLAPAPFGCMVLADLGAEVIRVERSGSGDALAVPSGYFDRGQKSIAVNLKSAEGVQVIKDLVADADVFVEGYRPGVAERLGVGPEDLWEINPRLIYGRLTGFGQDGPLASAAGHDINYISLAGALEPIGRAGERPYAPLNIVADFAGGGFLLVIGILAALRERETSGRGQVVDAAMVDGAALLTTFFHAMHASGLWMEERGTNLLDGGGAFYDTYECADGLYMAIGALEPQFYALLLDKLGLAEAELPHPWDVTQADVLRKAFADVFITKTRGEWSEIFADVDACVTPVLSPWEAHTHPHNVARDAFVEVDGKVQPAPAPRFSHTPAAVPAAAPAVGADSEALLRGLGYDDEKIEALRDAGAIG